MSENDANKTGKDPLDWDLAGAWQRLEQERKERLIRRAWAEGYKAGGDEEAKRRKEGLKEYLKEITNEPPLPPGIKRRG